jgi:anti-sigma B factor antagonist
MSARGGSVSTRGSSRAGDRTFPRLMSLRNRLTSCSSASAPGTSQHDGAARFQVDVQPEPRGARVRPVGEIDLATVDRVRRKIGELITAGCERIVLDLRGVTFMDSTGLHLGLDADAAARAGGWELLIIEGSGPVQRIFEVTGLRDRLPFVDAPPLPTPNRHPTVTRQGTASGEA